MHSVFNHFINKHKVIGRGTVCGELGSGYYKVKTAFEEFPLEAKCLEGKVSHGDEVNVGYINGDPHKPFIFSSKPRKSLPKPGTVIPPDEETPEPIFYPGLWAQQRGFWWQPGHSRESMPRFEFVASSAPLENQSMYKFVENLGLGPENEGTVVLFKDRIDYTAPWLVRKDGANVKSGTAEPSNVDGVFYHGTVSVDEDGVPAGNFSSVPEGIPTGSYDAFIFKGLDHDGNYTATYTRKPIGTKHVIRPNEIDDAARKSMAYKGLVLFPDGDKQALAVLTTHFVAEGEVRTQYPGQDHLHFVDPEDAAGPDQPVGQSFYLSYEPVGTIEDTAGTYGVPFVNLTYNSREFELLDGPSLTYGLRIKLNGSLNPRFFYLHRDGGATNVIESFEAEEAVQTFVVKPKQTNDCDGYFASDPLVLESYKITQIVSAKVNGEDDTEATFFGDTIRFELPIAEGDLVEYEVDGYDLRVSDQTFDAEDNQSEFEITNNLDEPGDLFRVIYMISGDVSGGETDFSPLCRVVSGTNLVQIFMYFSLGEDILIEYTYEQVTGDYYKTSEMRVYEVGGDYSGQRVLATPIPEKTLNPPNIDGGNFTSDRVVSEELGWFREGVLFFEPNTKSYNLASPAGLVWRSRALLSEPAPDLADPRVHYTFRTWPTSSVSADWYNTDPNYADFPENAPDVPVKNREYNHYCLSCGGPYALQGSWNRYGGITGDDTQTLPLWRRNTLTFQWENHQSIPLHKLADDGRDTSFPVRVHPMGKTDLFDRPNAQKPARSPGRWPLTKNYEAWIVAAPWVVNDFDKDINHQYDGEQRDPLEMGWKDAGLTFNAINPTTGEVMAQHTIKASKSLEDVLPKYENPRAYLDYVKDQNNESIEKSIDKYYNMNPIYYPYGNPEGELKPPHDGQNTVLASAIWMSIPVDDVIWRCYYRQTAYGEEVPRVLGYPGVPIFPSLEYKITAQLVPDRARIVWNGYNQPQTNEYLNVPQSPNLTLDEENNLYFVLNMPLWQRSLDIYTPKIGGSTPLLTRSKIHFFDAFESNQPQAFVGCDFGGALCTGSVTVTLNGAPWEAHNYEGFYSGFLVPYRSETVELFGTFVRYDGATEEFIGYPVYAYDASTIVVTWKQPDPAGFSEFLSPTGSFEYDTFIGYQATPLYPIGGMAIKEYQPDVSPDYVATTKPFLFKLHYDTQARSFTERWRKDVSQMTNWPPVELQTAGGEPIEASPLSRSELLCANWTLACGRYVFLIKDLVNSDPTNETNAGLSKRKSIIEIYKNQDEEPGSPRILEIPNTLSGDYSLNAVWCVGATCGVDTSGREHLLIKMKSGRGVSVLMPLDEGDDVEVEDVAMHFNDSGQPDFPEKGYDMNNLAQAGDSYYWMDAGNNVKKRTI